MSQILESGDIAHLDTLNVLSEGKLEVLVFQGVYHADAMQYAGRSLRRLLLEQEMRQDGRPLIVAALEFVFQFC